ncbi:hypothetical protein MMC14_000574 [Varicellaria rhodocarpa]|nr:hypothetical protein [Varicellaria rhodocarpa]
MSSVVRVLLEAKGLEIEDQAGKTLLQAALQNRDVASSKLLLQQGLPTPEIGDECQRWLNTQPLQQGKVPDPFRTKSEFSPNSPDDVFRAAVYLHRKLHSKPENLPLVNWILELAEYWTVTTSQRDGEDWYDENDPLPVYLRSIPIKGGRPANPVRRITFHVFSHDQSSGSGPGTFDGYTWFSVTRERLTEDNNKVPSPIDGGCSKTKPTVANGPTSTSPGRIKRGSIIHPTSPMKASKRGDLLTSAMVIGSFFSPRHSSSFGEITCGKPR